MADSCAIYGNVIYNMQRNDHDEKSPALKHANEKKNANAMRSRTRKVLHKQSYKANEENEKKMVSATNNNVKEIPNRKERHERVHTRPDRGGGAVMRNRNEGE